MPLPLHKEQTSPVLVHKARLFSTTSNPVISFFEFIKNFMEAIYEENLEKVVNMVRCVFENFGTARIYAYLAIHNLINWELREFMHNMYLFWEVLKTMPWC